MESVISQGESVPGTSGLCCELATDPAHLRSVRRKVRNWAADAGMSQDRIEDLVLAVDQAASSSIEFSRARPGPIWIDGHVALGQLRVVVTDWGQRGAPAAPNDLGLRIVDALTDHMHVEDSDGATAITMVWDLARIRLSSSRRPASLSGRR